jgi:hypothetical protein
MKVKVRSRHELKVRVNFLSIFEKTLKHSLYRSTETQKSDSYLDLHLDRQHIFIAVRIQIKSLDNKFQANNCMMMIRHASCES